MISCAFVFESLIVYLIELSDTKSSFVHQSYNISCNYVTVPSKRGWQVMIPKVPSKTGLQVMIPRVPSKTGWQVMIPDAVTRQRVNSTHLSLIVSYLGKTLFCQRYLLVTKVDYSIIIVLQLVFQISFNGDIFA